MASLATDLQIPKVPLIVDQQRSDRHALLREIAKESWLARTDIGYSVLTYESVMGILRDKRWHSATGMVAQLQGITDEAFLGRRRVSILNAEGEVHVRLRRLVAPAFSPRSADRLRPFMRETVNSLLDPFCCVWQSRSGWRHLRALPHSHHLRAARCTKGRLEALQPPC